MNMWIAALFSSFVLTACHAYDHHLLKKLVRHLDSDSAQNCDSKRSLEWNEAVTARYEISKKRLGFESNECLLAPLMKYDDFGPSGMGSSPITTEPLRKLLRSLFRNETMNIKSFFDAPCGDWVWMQYVDLSDVVYLGGDITSDTIKENKRCFAKNNVNFAVFDITCNKIPDVDLMLSRDVLFHLKPEIVLQILNNINKSKVRYFLSTTFMSPNEQNPFKMQSYGETAHKRGANSTIGYRDINLFDAPYCMPKPILKVQETQKFDGGSKPRYVALWKLPFTVGDCSAVEKQGDAAWSSF